MPRNTTMRLAAGAVTEEHLFCAVGPEGECLFSVRAGIPLGDACDQLSVLLTSSIEATERLACSSKDAADIPGALWESVHVLLLVDALVQSIHGGILAFEKKVSAEQPSPTMEGLEL